MEGAMSPKTPISIVVAGAALLLISARAGAQQPAASSASPTAQEALSATERQSAVNGGLARLADPTTRSVGSGPTPTLILEANSTSKIAGARIGFQYRDWLFDLKLRGVVDSTTRQAVFADLDGLRHKSTAEVGVIWTSYPARIATAAMDAACRQYEKVASAVARQRPCLIREGPGDAPGEAVARWLQPRRLLLAGVSGTVGPEQFSFASTPMSSSQTQARVNWAVAARVGVLFSDRLSIGGEYARTVEHQARDTRQFCVPIGETGVLECADKVVGRPTPLRSHLVTLELRRVFGSTFAVNPRWLLNPSTGAIGLDVPLYFLQSAKGGLAGGVTIGWHHSRRAGSTVEMTAFAGQVFGLILK
jgi:hypothetical protein